MLIVDSQVHLWGANTPARPWPDRGPAHRPVPISKDSLLADMQAAGIDRTIIVPPMWEGDRNDLALEAARLHPERFAVMGRLNPDDPASRGQLATWRQQPGMLGLRYSLHSPLLEPWLLEGRVDWVWAEAERAGVPIYVLVRPEMIHRIEQVALRHPRLKLAMDHLALPSGKKDEEAFGHLDWLLGLAKLPNVAVKVSSLPSYTTDPYPHRKIHGHIRRVYDAFGPQRMFWGSDLSRLSGTYRRCVTLFTEELPWLSAGDLEWIMGRAVCEWLDWKV